MFKIFGDIVMKRVCGFDCDGVLSIPVIGYSRIQPRVDDVIITGRSYEESEETLKYLRSNGIFNIVYFNPIKFKNKSRHSSGVHKANIIKKLKRIGLVDVEYFWEDDSIQIDVIKSECPEINIINIRHDLVEEGNVRRNEYGIELK